MSKESINDGVITLALPEGFHVMTQEEMVNFNGRKVKDNWAARDEDRHLVYNIAWNKISFLTAGVSAEKVLSNTERKIMKQVPGFVKIQDVKKTIAGQDVCGFRYSYKVQDINMIGEYLLLQYKKQNIAVIYLGRKGFFDENYELFEEMLSAMEVH